MKKIWELFFIYLKIGAFTIGGGYAMVPLIQEQIVDKKKWLTDKEFMDMFAVIQSAPGPIAVNSAVFLGYKVGGVKGSIMATLGAVIPSFTIILIIAMFFRNFREYSVVDSIFKGVRPAVVALIAAAVYKLVKSSKFSMAGIIISIFSLLAIIFLDIHPIVLILGSAALGIFISTHSTVRQGERK
ncbi:chromate transporter [Irregularibacter muris]|uniref:Chromate transporter n=1 Tax=Irregularibacter muris TaxID=1796619 RepID=A0AAE3KYV3_9FIRM|nr:chromate transporter [Irregularibacter muris]MCR1898260.1 chromate transporter [Irregularibacter muris]